MAGILPDHEKFGSESYITVLIQQKSYTVLQTKEINGHCLKRQTLFYESCNYLAYYKYPTYKNIIQNILTV